MKYFWHDYTLYRREDDDDAGHFEAYQGSEGWAEVRPSFDGLGMRPITDLQHRKFIRTGSLPSDAGS